MNVVLDVIRVGDCERYTGEKNVCKEVHQHARSTESAPLQNASATSSAAGICLSDKKEIA